MSLAYFRWFPGDYAKDTGHLTMLQHGAYRQLIDAYMGSGKPVRGDLNALCRICGALSGEERHAVEFVVAEFFQRDGPSWRNARCDRELDYLKTLSTAGQKAAQSRWRDGSAFAMRSQSDGNASQSQSHIHSQRQEPEPKPEDRKNKSQRPVATRLGPDWHLPDEWKDWAVKAYHLDPQKVVRISLGFRDYWIAKPKDASKLDWLATWRNWIRKECENA